MTADDTWSMMKEHWNRFLFLNSVFSGGIPWAGPLSAVHWQPHHSLVYKPWPGLWLPPPNDPAACITHIDHYIMTKGNETQWKLFLLNLHFGLSSTQCWWCIRAENKYCWRWVSVDNENHFPKSMSIHCFQNTYLYCWIKLKHGAVYSVRMYVHVHYAALQASAPGPPLVGRSSSAANHCSTWCLKEWVQRLILSLPLLLTLTNMPLFLNDCIHSLCKKAV